MRSLLHPACRSPLYEIAPAVDTSFAARLTATAAAPAFSLSPAIRSTALCSSVHSPAVHFAVSQIQTHEPPASNAMAPAPLFSFAVPPHHFDASALLPSSTLATCCTRPLSPTACCATASVPAALCADPGSRSHSSLSLTCSPPAACLSPLHESPAAASTYPSL